MNKLKKIFFLLLVIAIPIIIYLYFLQWKTTTMYGDDLYIYKSHAALNSFSEKINMPAVFQKYRPVHGFELHFLIEIFKKNVSGYYCFNIAIQVINTFLFALILNFFLKSAPLSLLFSLPVGLSRFSFFNITQLFNGGALEGLALTFFLLFLFYIIRAILIDSDPAHKHWDMLKAILYANFSMYTHERYIVLLPFVIILIIIYPGLKVLSRKQKTILSLIAIASVCLNVFVKKEIFHMAFFMGTGGSNIELSSSSPLTFFYNGLLSIFEINKGPDYLAGMRFDVLPFFNKSLVVILSVGFFFTFFIYFLRIGKPNVLNKEERPDHFWILPFLWVLLILLLIPAVITIRLEQRWLQASFSIFILSFIIAFSRIPFRNNYSRNFVFSLFTTLLLYCDYTYLYNGAGNFYITSAEKIATRFEEAIDKGIIRPGTKNLFIWEKQRDINTENTINWILAEGYFFNFYQQHEKKIIFADSSYVRDSLNSGTLINFKTNANQVINLNDSIIDITNDFLKNVQIQPDTSVKNK